MVLGAAFAGAVGRQARARYDKGARRAEGERELPAIVRMPKAILSALVAAAAHGDGEDGITGVQRLQQCKDLAHHVDGPGQLVSKRSSPIELIQFPQRGADGLAEARGDDFPVARAVAWCPLCTIVEELVELVELLL